MTQNNSTKLSHYPADFFVLRSPRLSLQQLSNWQSIDRKGLREQLRNWVELEETQEALYIASPSLLDRVKQWNDDPDSKKGKKIELTLTKYFIRMTGRPTPFGLFSNNSLGNLSDNTLLEFSTDVAVKRKSRLDMYYLLMAQEKLVDEQWYSQKLKLSTNPTVYKMGDQIRYIETYTATDERHYRLSSIDFCPYVLSALERAKCTASISELVAVLCVQNESLSAEDATDFIKQLVQARLLLPNLPLPLTGDSPDNSFVNSLLLADIGSHAKLLSDVLKSLKNLDLRVVNSPSAYRDIAKKLKMLSIPVKENKLIQVDCFRQNDSLQLDRKLCEKILQDTILFNTLISSSKNPLQKIITKINADSVGRMFPLQEFIDDESGWSMSSDTGFATPFLKGIGISQAMNSNDIEVKVTPFERLILEHLSTMTYPFQDEICFSSEDVKNCVINQQPLPDSMAVMFQLFNRDNEEKEVLYRGSYGPSAANLLGRFCHLDDELTEKTLDLLKKEEACNSDAIYAEIIHLPQGRIGNVIARPILRQYEIPIVGDPGTAKEFQLNLDDIYIYVESATVKLWSKKHNKEIIPRLSSAHNYSVKSLGVYNFLCILQNQNVSIPRFSYSSIFRSIKYLPRIKLGKLLLCKRRWQIKRSDLSHLLTSDSELNQENLLALKDKFKLSDWVSYSVSDNTLLINLSNPIMLDVLLAETNNHVWVSLEEVLDFEFESVSTLDGNFLKHEIILPLIKVKKTNKSGVDLLPTPNSQHIKASRIQRSFCPGSEWLSVKIYLGNSTAENLLVNAICPLIDELQEKSLIQGFFFLRYGDPDWHIRLRFKGVPQTLLTSVLPRLHEIIEPLVLNGPVKNLVIDTYEQEIERYGGIDGIKLAEEVFYSNSKTCLKLLNNVNELPDDYRWRSVIMGCDQLLNDFDFNLTQKLDFITMLRERFGREFDDSAILRKELGKKYREYKKIIQSDLSFGEDDKIITICRNILLKQTPAIRHVSHNYYNLEAKNKLTESLNSILSAIFHMFNNRMFVAYSRQQEFVVYDLMRRHYEFCFRSVESTH
jgi:thiopeptide-type bacteriocin biosynthesis protein